MKTAEFNYDVLNVVGSFIDSTDWSHFALVNKLWNAASIQFDKSQRFMEILRIAYATDPEGFKRYVRGFKSHHASMTIEPPEACIIRWGRHGNVVSDNGSCKGSFDLPAQCAELRGKIRPSRLECIWLNVNKSMLRTPLTARAKLEDLAQQISDRNCSVMSKIGCDKSAIEDYWREVHLIHLAQDKVPYERCVQVTGSIVIAIMAISAVYISKYTFSTLHAAYRYWF